MAPIRHALVGFAIGAMCVTSAQADDKPYAQFATDIAKVEAGGVWKTGKRWGRCRAVVRRRCSPEHCYDDLFVEWVDVSDRSAPKVVATTHIREIPGLTHVSEMKFVFPKKGTLLEVQHEGGAGDEDDRWTMCFQLGLPGKYTSKDGRCAG